MLMPCPYGTTPLGNTKSYMCVLICAWQVAGGPLSPTRARVSLGLNPSGVATRVAIPWVLTVSHQGGELANASSTNDRRGARSSAARRTATWLRSRRRSIASPGAPASAGTARPGPNDGQVGTRPASATGRVRSLEGVAAHALLGPAAGHHSTGLAPTSYRITFRPSRSGWPGLGSPNSASSIAGALRQPPTTLAHHASEVPQPWKR